MNIFEKFDIKTDNEEIYKKAFTHSSYASVHKLDYDYERLEFLGDSVLSSVVAEYLYKKYPQYGEGKLSKMRANFVCQNALIYYSKELELENHLKICIDEFKITDNEVISITADLFESLLGAMFIDQGFDFTKKFISDTIFKYIDEEKVFFNDYKSQIKEYADLNNLTIKYVILKEYGVPHDKIFIISCLVNDKEYGIGRGKSKKEAEQSAAKGALEKLKSGDK